MKSTIDCTLPWITRCDESNYSDVNLGEQCAKECTYTYDSSLTTCNQAVSDVTKNTYGANLDACANIASGIMDDCMVSAAPPPCRVRNGVGATADSCAVWLCCCVVLLVSTSSRCCLSLV